MLCKQRVPLRSEAPGEIRFTIHRRDEGADEVIRRFPSENGADVMVRCHDASGKITSKLIVGDGTESVAKKRGS